QRIEELRHKLEENFEKMEEGQIELRRFGEIQQMLQANLAVFVIKLSPMVQADQSMSLSKFDLKKTSFSAMAFPDQVGLDDEPIKVRSHTWLTNLTESDHPIQRVEYTKYLHAVLRLPPSGSVTLFDATPHRSLLSVAIEDVSVTGTTDLLLTCNASIPFMMASTALCAFEVKKVGETASNIHQACGELLALAHIQEPLRGRPFAVLTDLVDWWMFLWLSDQSVTSAEILSKPVVVTKRIYRNTAIRMLRSEVDEYRKAFDTSPDTRPFKRMRRSDEDEDGSGKRGSASRGAQDFWRESFTGRVSSGYSKPAACGSRDGGQGQMDSDIGLFRDDPDEIVSS
ncbi:hypothetical protein HDU93_009580, partial [Gonapodya sp. JEL0774]